MFLSLTPFWHHFVCSLGLQLGSHNIPNVRLTSEHRIYIYIYIYISVGFSFKLVTSRGVGIHPLVLTATIKIKTFFAYALESLRSSLYSELWVACCMLMRPLAFSVAFVILFDATSRDPSEKERLRSRRGGLARQVNI